MEKYLVDTNVIIDYLRDEPKAVSFLDRFDLTLVTRNIRHFKMIEGLKIENWELT